jgi:hypothetical protein
MDDMWTGSSASGAILQPLLRLDILQLDDSCRWSKKLSRFGGLFAAICLSHSLPNKPKTPENRIVTGTKRFPALCPALVKMRQAVTRQQQFHSASEAATAASLAKVGTERLALAA